MHLLTHNVDARCNEDMREKRFEHSFTDVLNDNVRSYTKKRTHANELLHTGRIGIPDNLFVHTTDQTVGRHVVQGVGNMRQFVSSDKPFLVKPFGCGICGEVFEIETDCVEHGYQVCYFPVEDDFAVFFKNEQQNALICD